jgi:hypothetical protein
MSEFSTGVRTGAAGAVNPFAVAISRMNELKAEKAKSDQNIAKETFALNKMLTSLGAKHEHDIALEREKVRLKGTPVDALSQARTQPSGPGQDAQIGQGQAIADVSGVGRRGKEVLLDPETGEKTFIPESPSEEMSRLKLEAARKKSTPEGRRELIMEEAQAKAEIKRATDRVAQQTKIELGKLVSKSNLETLAGVTRDLSSVFRDAFKEGGAGGLIQTTIAGAAEKLGDLPGGTEVGGHFAASGGFPGKRQELILKMMPMLTQQATKPEGSVRLIEGVLRAIGQTIPDRGTAPRQAKRQLKESLLSFYRFARASELLGIEFDKVLKDLDINSLEDTENVSDEDIDSKLSPWINSVNAAANRVELGGEELKALENMVDKSLSPLDEIIKGSEKKALEVTPEQRSEFNKLRSQGISKEEARKKVGF